MFVPFRFLSFGISWVTLLCIQFAFILYVHFFTLDPLCVNFRTFLAIWFHSRFHFGCKLDPLCCFLGHVFGRVWVDFWYTSGAFWLFLALFGSFLALLVLFDYHPKEVSNNKSYFSWFTRTESVTLMGKLEPQIGSTF